MTQQHLDIRPPADTQELRFAVTMNGGVSLAVYIGGVAQELNLLSKAAPDPQHNGQPSRDPATRGANPYGALLALLGFTAPAIDVITGTSAGGINAAALAVAQADDNGDIAVLKPLWLHDAQIEALLRKPFQTGAPSLMKGDEYFLPRLQSAFRRMTSRTTYRRSQNEINLTITTTLLTPIDRRSSDDLGTAMVEPEFAGLFKFSGRKDSNATEERPDHFSDDTIGRTAEALALAARASAGFPVAFEPTFIPVNDDRPFDDRPDMADFVDWAKKGGPPASRYGVDGGVLNNTPTLPALHGIQQRAAKAQFVRRVLILVHPHALDARTVCDPPDVIANPPTLLDAIQGVAKAATSVGSKAYMAEIEEYNRQALRWRDTRTVTLTKFGSWDQLRQFLDDEPRSAWTLFRSMRIQRNSVVIAKAVHRPGELTLAKVKEEAQRFHEKQDKTPQGLPYLPKQPPTSSSTPRGGWPWGIALATGVTSLIADQLETLSKTNNAGLCDQIEAAWTVVINDQIVINQQREQLREQAKKEADDCTGGHRARFTRYLQVYREQMGTAGAGGSAPREAVGIGGTPSAAPNPPGSAGTVVAQRVASSVQAFARVLELDNVTESLDTRLFDGATSEDLLQRLLSVEVVSYLLSENSDPDSEGRSGYIELVQLSAQEPQHFAEGFSSDDKLAGMSLGRFGAFIKRSWRANDWIWGRLDGAKALMLVLLTSDTITRIENSSRQDGEPDDALASRIVDGIGRVAFGGPATFELLTTGKLRALYRDACREVNAVLQGKKEGQLPNLASLAAYGPQMMIAAEEMTSLKEAIEEDRRRGAVGVRAERLLTKLAGPQSDSGDIAELHGYRQLMMFGDPATAIGREGIAEQLPSDALIRTASTAIATTASVLGSDRSGLGPARGLTLAVRGAVGLPYWTLQGLTHRGHLARLGAAILLALGVSLVAVSFVAPLSGVLAGLLPVLGFGSLLTVVAYGALRTQALVHVAALLGLFIPLITLGLYQTGKTPGQEVGENLLSSHPIGLLSIACIAALIVGSIVIANLTPPFHSPLSAAQNGLEKLVKFLKRNNWELALVAGVGSIAILLWITPGSRNAIRTFADRLVADDRGEWLTGFPFCYGVYTFIVLAGWAASLALSWRLRPVRPINTTRNKHRGRLTDPAGLAIAWSSIYGTIYVGVTYLLVRAAPVLGGKWAMVPAYISLALAVLFSQVAVVFIWFKAKTTLVKRLAAYFASRESFPPKTNEDKLLEAFLAVGADSSYLLTAGCTSLSRWGRRVANRARRRWEAERNTGRSAAPRLMSAGQLALVDSAPRKRTAPSRGTARRGDRNDGSPEEADATVSDRLDHEPL